MRELKKTKISGHNFLNPKYILEQSGVKCGDWVADLGCGGGYYVLPASRIVGDEGKVYAVDILKPALSAVASKAKLFGLNNIVLVWANVEIYGASRGIDDQSVDFVLLTQLLSQSKKRQGILKEADRILKTGGKLVVVDWMSDKLPFSPDKNNHISREEVKKLAKTVFLKFDYELEVGPYHYCLVFDKY